MFKLEYGCGKEIQKSNATLEIGKDLNVTTLKIKAECK